LSMSQAVENIHSPYCILVIPLLVETGFNDLVDRVLVVTADETMRINWIRERSGLDNRQIESIMATQASDDERKYVADDVIENNGSLGSLFFKTKELDKKYKTLASLNAP
ncbi:MAG: dephospho-CoA kinase, partial [Gammaproteobacteria bacterium]|nr:dephospho-CoA kinase [Gammaproteobacteria bacterium]